MSANGRLKELYAQINALSEEIPAQLSKKISLYTHVLELLGKLHADAVNEEGLAEADRKRIYSETVVSAQGTATDKAARAEISCYDARKREAFAKAESWRYRNAYTSTQEVINALKLELKSLMQELNNTNTE
ncbi:MAG: hypothetical protein ACE3JK_10525 [Sporolactobacillus sp.]